MKRDVASVLSPYKPSRLASKQDMAVGGLVPSISFSSIVLCYYYIMDNTIMDEKHPALWGRIGATTNQQIDPTHQMEFSDRFKNRSDASFLLFVAKSGGPRDVPSPAASKRAVVRISLIILASQHQHKSIRLEK